MSFPNYPSGQPAAGTQIQFAPAGSSPENFGPGYRLDNINGPQMSTKEVETTSHKGVLADGRIFDTWVPTVISAGKIAFNLFIKTDDPSDQLLLSYFVTRQLLDCRIVEADQKLSHSDFQAFFTMFKLEHPVNGVVKASCEMRCTGPIYLLEE